MFLFSTKQDLLIKYWFQNLFQATVRFTDETNPPMLKMVQIMQRFYLLSSYSSSQIFLLSKFDGFCCAYMLKPTSSKVLITSIYLPSTNRLFLKNDSEQRELLEFLNLFNYDETFYL